MVGTFGCESDSDGGLLRIELLNRIFSLRRADRSRNYPPAPGPKSWRFRTEFPTGYRADSFPASWIRRFIGAFLRLSEVPRHLVTEIAQGSPADGALKIGDRILGVDGKPLPLPWPDVARPHVRPNRESRLEYRDDEGNYGRFQAIASNAADIMPNTSDAVPTFAMEAGHPCSCSIPLGCWSEAPHWSCSSSSHG